MKLEHLTKKGLVALVRELQAKLERINSLKRERTKKWRARKRPK